MDNRPDGEKDECKHEWTLKHATTFCSPPYATYQCTKCNETLVTSEELETKEETIRVLKEAHARIQLLESRLKVAEDALNEAYEVSDLFQKDYAGHTHEVSGSERICLMRKVIDAWKKTKGE